MAYVDYEYYKSLYGEKALSEADFNRLSWDAGRKLDIATTGVDNVKKLKVAFPVDEDDAEAVKRCVCKLIEIASAIEQAEQNARSAQGYITREDGSLQGRVVTSASAGNETLSFSAFGGSSGASTLIDAVMTDKKAQDQLYSDTIKDYLSGIVDANGVNLLYMGRYPYRLEK